MTPADLASAVPALSALLSMPCVEGVTIRTGQPVTVSILRQGRETVHFFGADLSAAAARAVHAMAVRPQVNEP